MARSAAPLADSLDASKLYFVDVDGIRTRYYDDGRGEPLVLLHGGHFGFLDSLDCWSLNLPGLAERFRVLALDKLGQGHTANPPTDAEYTFEALLRHTARWLELLGVRQAHLVGHSRGGLLVALLALEYPELAKTVVIVDSNTLAPDDPRWPGGVFYERIEARVPPGPPTLETVRLEPDANSYSTAHVTDDWMARYLEIARLPKHQHARARMREIGETIWMPSLRRSKQRALEGIAERGLPVPTLVVWGYNDPSAGFPLALALYERLVARQPRTELHVLNEAGHYSFRERPREFNRLLAAFCLE